MPVGIGIHSGVGVGVGVGGAVKSGQSVSNKKSGIEALMSAVHKGRQTANEHSHIAVGSAVRRTSSSLRSLRAQISSSSLRTQTAVGYRNSLKSNKTVGIVRVVAAVRPRHSALGRNSQQKRQPHRARRHRQRIDATSTRSELDDGSNGLRSPLRSVSCRRSSR